MAAKRERRAYALSTDDDAPWAREPGALTVTEHTPEWAAWLAAEGRELLSGQPSRLEALAYHAFHAGLWVGLGNQPEPQAEPEPITTPCLPGMTTGRGSGKRRR